MADPVAAVRRVYDAAGMTWDDGVRAAVSAELEASRSGPRAPRHQYALGDYGLAEDEVRDRFC